MKLTDNIVSVRHFVDDMERLFRVDDTLIEERLNSMRIAVADKIADSVKITETKHDTYTEYSAKVYVFTPEELKSFIAYIEKTKTPTEE